MYSMTRVVIARTDNGLIEVRQAGQGDAPYSAEVRLPGGAVSLDLRAPAAGLHVHIADPVFAAQWLPLVAGTEVDDAVRAVAERGGSAHVDTAWGPLAPAVARLLTARFLQRWWPVTDAILAPEEWLLDVEVAVASAALPDGPDTADPVGLLGSHAGRIAALDANDPLRDAVLTALEHDGGEGAQVAIERIESGGAGPADQALATAAGPRGEPIPLDPSSLPPRLLHSGAGRCRWWRDGEDLVVRADAVHDTPDPAARLYARITAGSPDCIGRRMHWRDGGYETVMHAPVTGRDSRVEVYDGRYSAGYPEPQDQQEASLLRAAIEAVVERRLDRALDPGAADAGFDVAPFRAEVEAAERRLASRGLSDLDDFLALHAFVLEAGRTLTLDAAERSAEPPPADDGSGPFRGVRQIGMTDLALWEALLGRPPRPFVSFDEPGEYAPVLSIEVDEPGLVRVRLLGLDDVRDPRPVRVTVQPGLPVPLRFDPVGDHGRPCFSGTAPGAPTAKQVREARPVVEVSGR